MFFIEKGVIPIISKVNRNLIVNNILSKPELEIKFFRFSEHFSNNISNFEHIETNFDTIYCKKSKLDFIRVPDWSSRYNVPEFRTLMFTKYFGKHPPVAYITNKEKVHFVNNLNINVFNRLYEYEYHDPEVVDYIKFGIKSPRCKDSRGKMFRDSVMTYTHCNKTSVLEYFKQDVKGPFSRKQICEQFKYPVVVSAVMTLTKPNKKIRCVIDKKNYSLTYEKLSDNVTKMRLPSIREIMTFIDIDRVTAISIIDFSNYFRQLKTNRYDQGCCVLKRDTEEYFVDQKAQMGARDIPMACQRISSALSFIYNVENPNAASFVYQDDTIIFSYAGCNSDAIRDANIFLNLAQEAGLNVKHDKSVIASQVAVWLGITLNLTTKTIYPSQRRLDSIVKLIKLFLNNEKCSLEQLQSLLGKMSSLSFAGYHNLKSMMYNVRELDREKYALNGVKFKQEHKLELNIALKSISYLSSHSHISFNAIKFLVSKKYIDHKLCNNNIPINTLSKLIKISRELIPSENYIVSITDASLEYSGGVIIYNEVVHKFKYKNDIFAEFTIDKLECIVLVIGALLTTTLCLHSELNCPSEGLILLTDNEITRYVINNANARCNVLKKLNGLLTFSLNKARLWYKVVRISSSENYVTDALSRNKDLDDIIDLSVNEFDEKTVNSYLLDVKTIISDMSYFKFLESLE